MTCTPQGNIIQEMQGLATNMEKNSNTVIENLLLIYWILVQNRWIDITNGYAEP